MAELNIDKMKEYAIHDYFESEWDKKPRDVLTNHRINYTLYLFNDINTGVPMGYLYVYKTDPLTNLIIYSEIGVTDDCPIAEIEVPC